MKKNRIRLTESQLHRVIKESVKRALVEKFNGSVAHEDALRQEVGKMASQIKSMIEKLTRYEQGMNNYLADLVQGEQWVDKLYDVMFDMEDFSKTSSQRQQDAADALAMPEGGYERFGY